ncbi:MAG: peptidase M15 [Burkholderiaceae bacterium]|nr:peptidase M15 [Burkholderiaceae bacterium]
MNLSEHFTLEELVASQLAARQRIDNRPTTVVIENLRRVAAVLEQIRDLVGKPVMVSSGYRSMALNKAVGGAPVSAHLDGLAADISVPGMTARALAVAIRDSGIVLDQLIYEGTWVHVGLTSGKPRRQVLTARFGPGGTTYSQGIA